MILRYPATGRMLEAARRTGALDPAAAMHRERWVALHVALGYAHREHEGLEPINRGPALVVDTGESWSPQTTALILTVSVSETTLLPAAADWRCRYSATPIPVRAIRDVVDVTHYRATPEHARATHRVHAALQADAAAGVNALQREILESAAQS